MKRTILVLLAVMTLQPMLAMQAPKKAAAPIKNAPKKIANSSPMAVSAVSIESFRQSIIDNDAQAVRRYIQSKGDVNVVFSDGLNCLGVAEKYFRSRNIREMLIRAGATKLVEKPKLERKPEQKTLSNAMHLYGDDGAYWHDIDDYSEMDRQEMEDAAEQEYLDSRGGYPDEGSD